MEVKFKFDVMDHVTITPFDKLPGRIMQQKRDTWGVMYRVKYYWGNEQHFEDFQEDELELKK
jgi:hypothetical protein